jgi:hypothetical protein
MSIGVRHALRITDVQHVPFNDSQQGRSLLSCRVRPSPQCSTRRSTRIPLVHVDPHVSTHAAAVGLTVTRADAGADGERVGGVGHHVAGEQRASR